MKVLKLLIGTIIIGLTLTYCDKETDNSSTVCDKSVIVDEDQYNNEPNDQLTIISAELDNDCLKINFASSGCSGSSWEVKLIDSGVILYSDPPQRNLRLSLKNQELCDAYIGKEITFDIGDLRINRDKVLLNLTNSGDQILYEY
ncbi:hypothetical protein SAMN05444285_10721 [Draconibacterium orientale]|uniref:Uncharacterized protein n=1 Tax=Draconibacterium orientale TaxID=1168034 RepID=X5DMP4_9BACT|nr:hypothetical protein [Draconibacterium orientale]AHW61852.1 hypothetical protein FH5T_09585 [Draconibacterium orientale]SET15957.1 hypothetical protein SAMN05444285_10721 [Draconibacterium orientale]